MTGSKIFLIEDDHTMLKLLRTLLSFEGFDISQLGEEETLEEILASVRTIMPNLILLDVHLRKLDGFDFLKLIRLDKKTKNIRVLMSSGMDYGTRCIDEGADGFILKPYMPEDLIAQIRQALQE